MEIFDMRESLARDAANMRSLNFSETYIKETTGNTHRWGQTGLLQGIEDPYVARQLARLLENQRVQNDNSEPYRFPEGASTNWIESQWKRVSVPAIRRVFGAFVPYNLVSVQAMAKLEDRLYFTGLDERQTSIVVNAMTRSLGREWWHSGEMFGENGQHSLDKETAELAGFSQRYSNEVTREIIRDLRNNPGSKAQAEYTDPEGLLSLVEGMSAYIAAKIKGRDASWIVASPQVAELLRPFVQEWKDEENPHDLDSPAHKWDEQSTRYRGMLKDKWKLYEEPFSPPGKLLMGHKDSKNHYFSGYFYCPYHPFNMQPGWWMEDNNNHNHQTLLARYGKKLIDANFYGLIDISNLPQVVQPETAVEEPAKAESEA